MSLTFLNAFRTKYTSKNLFRISKLLAKSEKKFNSNNSFRLLSYSPTEVNSDDIFDLICEQNETVSCTELKNSLASCGLWREDVRLKRFFHEMRHLEGSKNNEEITKEEFKHLIKGREELFQKVIYDDFAIPNFSRFCKELNSIYRNCRTNWQGEITTWPYSAKSFQGTLGSSGSDYWAVSVCSVDGQMHNMGDVGVLFPIHSCSWPLSYTVATEQLGAKELRRFIGKDVQNNLSDRRRYHHHQLPTSLYNYLTDNPLSLPGSIVISSLLYRGLNTDERNIDRLLNDYKRLVKSHKGDDEDEDGADDEGAFHMKINEDLYTLARNESHFFRAVGHLLEYSNCIPGVCLEDALELHLRACCLETDAKTLSLLGATIANGGVCPTSSNPSASSINTRDILTYLHSHSSLSRSLGIPLMTSSTGGVLMVVDGLMAICMWSPPLDGGGFSCRSLQFIQEMMERFNLHESSSKLTLNNKLNPRERRSFQKAGHVGDLLFSAFRGDLHSLQDMHRKGLNMQSRDYDGRSALHVASSEGRFEIVKFLVDTCDASMSMVDRWSRTPLDEAVRMDRSDIESFLRDRMIQKGVMLE